MSFVYLTPASISFLAQFILSLAITGFLALRLLRSRTLQQVLLTGFFGGATAFIGLMFLDVSLWPFPRLLVVYVENAVLALAWVLLLQFAYRFPQPYPQHRWEARAGLVIGLAYFLCETVFMVYRYVSLLGQGMVEYRPLFLVYVMGLVLALPPIAFVRQCIAADVRTMDRSTGRPVSWLRKLWKPEGKGARGARSFVGVFGIVFVLGLTNMAMILGLPNVVYNASLSIGVLISLWLFASSYISFLPVGVSVQAKLSVLALTLFLALLGSVGWFIAPPYIKTFQPNLTDHETVRFRPNDLGAYDIEQVAFAFESELGERLPISHGHRVSNYPIAFDFPFYGQVYDEIYVSSYGALVLGEPFWEPKIQAQTASFPAIVPLLIDLDPAGLAAQDSGVYVRLDEGAEHLVVTWNHLPVFSRPNARFTFQVSLHRDGVFDVTYNGLPLPYVFDPDASPRDNPWLWGIVSGQGEPLHTNAADLLTTAQSGGYPLIENYQLAFRSYLHDFMLPLAVVVIGGSLVLATVLPLLLQSSIVKPLAALTAGARQIESGDLDVELVIQQEDEIGYLTRAFNNMAARLSDLVDKLEARVATRTAELAARTEELDLSNAQLRAEMAERELVQKTVIEQQRILAAFEERERMGRELHDGLGQVLGYVNVQAQAVDTLLAQEQSDAARVNLRQLAQAAREGHNDVRSYILGLRAPDQAREVEFDGFWPVLHLYLAQFERMYGLAPQLTLAANLSDPLFAPGVEQQVLRIVQEALANTGKHARANHIEVTFSLAGEQVQIVVADDGLGFVPPTAVDSGVSEPARAQGAHLGLGIMHERAKQVGGQLEVQSRPGFGTRITATLPRFLPAEGEGADAQIKGLRLLLVDDQPLFIEGLRNLLTARGLTVVGWARDGQEALVKTRALRPDVVVMDLRMPRGNGLEATRAIKAEMPEVQVVILTMSEDEESLFEAIRSGAAGYLLKNLEVNKFCSLLTGLLRGETPLSPGLAERLLNEFARSVSPREAEGGEPGEVMTPRQWEILCLVADGMIYKEIGEALYLSEGTIKYHMSQILQKLQVKSRSEAISYAHRMRQE